DRKQDRRARHADLVAQDAAADGGPIAPRFGRRRGLKCCVLDGAGRDHAHPQPRLMRGSIAACAISTSRLRSTKNSASTRMVPCNSGKSRWKIAELSSRPEPGHENTVSIRIDPPSIYPN